MPVIHECWCWIDLSVTNLAISSVPHILHFLIHSFNTHLPLIYLDGHPYIQLQSYSSILLYSFTYFTFFCHSLLLAPNRAHSNHWDGPPASHTVNDFTHLFCFICSVCPLLCPFLPLSALMLVLSRHKIMSSFSSLKHLKEKTWCVSKSVSE